jgi:hypothetical protein
MGRFRRRVLCLLSSKNTFSSCHWKRHCVLFHVEWRMSMLVVRFVFGGLFFIFLFFSLSTLENYSLTLFVVGILTSALIILISNFCSWFFYRSFICFQFHHSISIYKILYFSIWSLFFWFLIFFPLTFCKSFIGF